MKNGILEHILIYPVKGLPGISLKKVSVVPTGLSYDRVFMLVDESGVFISQRTHPILTQIQTELRNKEVRLTYDSSSIELPLEPSKSIDSMSVQIWSHDLEAAVIFTDINNWFSEILGMKVFLVYQDAHGLRMKKIPNREADIPLQFTDGYPVHFFSTASLQDLGSRLQFDVHHNRFRPNLIVSGLEAYEEENYDLMSISDVRMDIIKPTVRCAVPNIDQTSGQQGKEPISTLSKYKRQGKGVTFGMYAAILQNGQVSVGDQVAFTTIA